MDCRLLLQAPDLLGSSVPGILLVRILSCRALHIYIWRAPHIYIYICALWTVIYMRPRTGKITPAKSLKKSPCCSVIKPRRGRKRETEIILSDFTCSWLWMQLFLRICEHVSEIYFQDGARGEKSKSYGLAWRNMVYQWGWRKYEDVNWQGKCQGWRGLVTGSLSQNLSL